jgi:hypothetical protein
MLMAEPGQELGLFKTQRPPRRFKLDPECNSSDSDDKVGNSQSCTCALVSPVPVEWQFEPRKLTSEDSLFFTLQPLLSYGSCLFGSQSGFTQKTPVFWLQAAQNVLRQWSG